MVSQSLIDAILGDQLLRTSYQQFSFFFRRFQIFRDFSSGRRSAVVNIPDGLGIVHPSHEWKIEGMFWGKDTSMRLGLAIIGNSTASAAQLKVFSNDLTLGGEVGGRGPLFISPVSQRNEKNFAQPLLLRSVQNRFGREAWFIVLLWIARTNQTMFSCTWVRFSLFEGKKRECGFLLGKKQLGLNKHGFIIIIIRHAVTHQQQLLVRGTRVFAWQSHSKFVGCSGNWEIQPRAKG